MAAARKKKKPKTVSFQLTYWGVFCLAAVSFCIFLWMFLVGVWVGQSVLGPEPVASIRCLPGLEAERGLDRA